MKDVEHYKNLLGETIDSLESLIYALNLPMADSIHVSCMRTELPDILKGLKESYINLMNENPWE